MTDLEKSSKTVASKLIAMFQVDGDCTLVASIKLPINNKQTSGNVFELTDSARGTFYVSITTIDEELTINQP